LAIAFSTIASAHPGRRDRVLPDVLVGDRDRRVAGERRPAGEQFVQQAAGRVQVAAGIDPLAPGLLRRQVLRGSDHLSRLGHGGLGVAHRAGDAEVHDLDVAVAGHHHVARLDVAVHDAGLVAVVQRAQYPVDDLQRAFGQQPVAVLQQVADGPAVHVLHDDVRHGDPGRHVLAGIVDRHDVRVVKGCRGLGLAPEPRLEYLVPGQVGAQRLDRHDPVEPDVARAVDLCHAAAAHDAVELVAAAE
jgi:hypothetical protein